jgi:O-antigen ligase
MARPAEKGVMDADEDVALPRHGRLLAIVRMLADWTVVLLVFAVIALAALPMGANRDWAWAPIAVVVGTLAVAVAAGLGSRSGFDVSEAERVPLIGLVACFVLFVAFGLFQRSTLGTALSDSAWLYEGAARVLGRAHPPVPDLAIDAARNTLLKCLTCGAIFLMARALCRDRGRARLLLMIVVGSTVLVAIYGVASHLTTASCYLGQYLRKIGDLTPGYTCVMSGTFVNSNSFGCYCGMGIVAAMALAFADRRRSEDMPYGYDEDDGDGFMESLTGLRLLMLAVGLLLLGGLLLSASRAGAVATFISAGALSFLMLRDLWRTRPGFVKAFVVGAFIIAVVVLLIAGGAIANKVAINTDFGVDRTRIWLAALQAIRMSPWVGWGLGSFADIYAIVQPATISLAQPNDLAHSTPLETVVEVGVPMALVGFAVVLIPWGVTLRGALLRRRSHRYLPAGAFAVAAVPILHSLVDFSLQMPAIAFVVSAVLGLGWAQAFGRRERSRGGYTPWE